MPQIRNIHLRKFVAEARDSAFRFTNEPSVSRVYRDFSRGVCEQGLGKLKAVTRGRPDSFGPKHLGIFETFSWFQFGRRIGSTPTSTPVFELAARWFINCRWTHLVQDAIGRITVLYFYHSLFCYDIVLLFLIIQLRYRI